MSQAVHELPHMADTKAPPAIVLDKVNKWYGTMHVLRDVSLTIAEKEYGANSPVLAPILKNDAAALRELGRKDEADKMDQRLASIRATTMKTN